MLTSTLCMGCVEVRAPQAQTLIACGVVKRAIALQDFVAQFFPRICVVREPFLRDMAVVDDGIGQEFRELLRVLLVRCCESVTCDAIFASKLDMLMIACASALIRSSG